jgi:starch synthase
VEILFVTSELAPFSANTDMAEVAAALPKALRGIGHKVTVVSPLYAGIDPTARSLARRLSTFSVEAAGRSYNCQVYDGRTTGGVDLIFLANPELFSERGPHEGSTEQQLVAAAVFGGAVAQLVAKREPAFELLHAHGALAGLALLQTKALLPELPRVLSIHDLGDDTRLSSSELEKLGLSATLRDALASHSLLGAATRAANLVIANAPSTARAWASDPSGELGAVLHAKGDRLVGIVNGVDASIWNPLTDSNLSARFDPVDMSGKARCKAALQFGVGLAVQNGTPLVAVLGELSPARGGDLIIEAAEKLLRNALQLLFLTSDDEQAKALRGLATDMPERIAVRTSFTDKERHLALAGADFLLLPARKPVSIDLALCALRYGTLPIVRPVGALADMIVDADAKLETGNGFVAQDETVEELVSTTARAVASYGQAPVFDALRRRVMRTDVSWERAARRYEYAYRQLKAAAQSAA